MIASREHWIGDALVAELERGLQAGKHFALLGPRHAAKARVLELLETASTKKGTASQPRILVLKWSDHFEGGPEAFLEHLAGRLGSIIEPAAPDARLSGRIEEIFLETLRSRATPLWVLVQDILGFQKPIARELLAAFNSLHEQLSASGNMNRFGVVVTGSSDFTPLTIGPNSPYRHATKIVVRGLDPAFAKEFFQERRRRLLGPDADLSMPDDVFKYLYERTRGNAHLLQELAIAPARHPYLNEPKQGCIVYRSLESAQIMVEHYVRNFMPDDHYSIAMLREAEQKPEWFAKLLSVCRGEKAPVPRGEPHGMEVCGLLSLNAEHNWQFSCPMIEDFVLARLTPRHIADVYARQRSWPEAWSAYAEMESAYPELRDRPISGVVQDDLHQAILVWKDQLMDEAQHSVSRVVAHFMMGMQHLFGFDRGGLLNREDGSWNDAAVFGDIAGEEPSMPPSVEAYPEGDTICLGDQLGIWCAIPARNVLSEWPRSALFLKRFRAGCEIDSPELVLIRNILSRFIIAYKAAEETEYQRRIGELRKKHDRVIEAVNKTVLQDKFDMEKVVQKTAETLIEDADYYRVQICLVNANRTRIQSVASRCAPNALDFTQTTNYELSDPSADIQAYVVACLVSESVPDAATWEEPRFKINKEQSIAIGMKAFAVVPMITRRQVVGTPHIERSDRKQLGVDELKLIQFLADYLAGVFRQAQRVELLHAAVDALMDEVRIMDPASRIVYVNQAAANASQPQLTAGWQHPAVEDDWERHAWAPNAPRRDEAMQAALEKGKENVRYFLKSSEAEPPRAQSLELRRIDDFRSFLVGPFEADPVLGIVEYRRDLTPLYEQLTDLTRWLRAQSVAEAANSIVMTAVERGFDWCRLYLLQKNEDETQQLIREACALRRNSEIVRMVDSGVILKPEDQPLRHAWTALKIIRRPAIFTYEPDLSEENPPYEQDGAWWHHTPRRIDAPQQNHDGVDRWIEAPLMVGDRVVGVMELSLPDGWLNPRAWAFLETFVQGAALTLDGLRRAEEMTGIEKRTAESMIWIFHQFRQPLFEGRGQWRRLKRVLGHDPVESGSSPLEGIGRALHAMERISADYQSYIRPYAPKIERGNLAEALRQTCEKTIAYTDLVDVQFEADTVSANVITDIAELQRITDELVYNAIKAGAPGVWVTITTDRVSGMSMLIVKDNGPGVSEEKQARLWDADPNKASGGGTGYGLANVSKHLTRLDGKITYMSCLPRGAQFTVTVPVRFDDQEGLHAD